MDAVFFNGRINTFDPESRVLQAVGVAGGQISALGDSDQVRSLAGSGTRMVDLKGASLFPGFIDCHNHLMIFAYLLNGLDLSSPAVGGIQDMKGLVKEAVQVTAPGDWIRGSRFAEYWLKENRYPTKFDLDPVSPDHPVIFYHTSFHACVLNSRALEKLGLTKESPVPEGGIIEKDPRTGELTGVLHDSAMMEAAFTRLFNQDLEAMPAEKRVAMCARGMEEFAKVGVTAVADALVTPASLAAYQETLAAGKAKVRVYLMPEMNASRALLSSGIRTGFGGDWLRIGPLKIFEDGGMSNRTAAVGTPYLTPSHGRGLKVLSREKMIAAVKLAHDKGFQVAVHCQGDDGLADTLDAFEGVLGPDSENPLRHRIEHGGCLYPDLLRRAVRMNIGVSTQPAMIKVLGDGWLEAFGTKGVKQLYPLKSMLQAGIKVGGSSDCPVVSHDPRLGLQGALMRRTAAGHPFGPQEALTMDQALRMYTQGSAYLNGEDRSCGTLELGKQADFTVLEADPREVDVEEVDRIPVVMTVVGGELTFKR